MKTHPELEEYENTIFWNIREQLQQLLRILHGRPGCTEKEKYVSLLIEQTFDEQEKLQNL